jgi:SAM-dependent methyltransferase
VLSTIKKVKKMVPLPIRRRLRKAWLVTYKLNDLLSPSSNMVPWRQYALSVGGGDFEAVGREYLGYFKTLARLKPTESVLDVGCGIGRLAVPLTGYLHGSTYDGFDNVEASVKWCTKRIASQYPSFHFRHVDVYNEHYNPRGEVRASEFVFPYESNSFDFAFLISVFTHMLPDDMTNYLSEVARVLKPGGRCLITYTLLNDQAIELIDAGKSALPYHHQFESYRSVERDEPETSIAYYEDDTRALYEKAGLQIEEPIHYGKWCGRDGLAFQDIVIAYKQ